MNHQEIVTLIKKMALSDAPGVEPAKPSAAPITPMRPELSAPPGTQSPLDTEHGTGMRVSEAPSSQSGGYGDPGIAKMQEALIGLAQDVTSQLNVQNLTGPTPNQEAVGRDSFGDFFAKHYLRNDDVPGIEYSPDPTKTQMADKDPRAASKLSWVMDTMHRLGSSKAEGFIDGNWGPRTNASLVNAYALATGLLKLANDFKVPVRSYSEAALQELKPAIREDNDLPMQYKTRNAPAITQQLRAIRRMYNEIKQHILEKPQWRAAIEGAKPYVHYQGQGLSSQQLASIKQTFPQGFSIPINDQGATAKIDVDNLASVEALKQWLTQTKTQMNPTNVIKSVMQQIGTTSTNPNVSI
jgi:hypothetical protein